MKTRLVVALLFVISAGVFSQEAPKSSTVPPKVISSPDPYFTPSELKKVNGRSIVLWVDVSEDGKVKSVQVARSIDPKVDQRAIDAVKRWKFKPAQRDGKPIAAKINVQIVPRLVTDRRH